MNNEKIKNLKSEVRRRIWKQLEETGVARFPRPVFGRIPNFEGAEAAAANLAGLDQFVRARVVKVNPDAPQRRVRYNALAAGKTLVMPTPRLREGFLLIDPRELPKTSLAKVSAISGAFQFGRKVELEDLPKVDLIVLGCVAVSTRGARVGKGEGYGEIEYALLREKGKVDNSVPVVTTVHESQIVDELPWEMHDVPVDLIVTQNRVVATETSIPKPTRVYWERLNEEKLREIPLLQRLRREAK